MGNLRIVRVPILERVALEALAERWHLSADEAMKRIIRQAAQQALHDVHAGMVCPHCGVELMVTVTAVELKGVETHSEEWRAAG